MLPAMLVILMAAPPEEPKLPEAALKELKKLKKLEGKWDLVQVDRDGKSVTLKQGEATITIKGTKWTATTEDRVFQEFEVVALDPKTKPARIDFKTLPRPELKREGNTYEAIFKLEGDMLYYVVYNGKDKNRPTSFDPPSDTDTQLMILKRVKE